MMSNTLEHLSEQVDRVLDSFLYEISSFISFESKEKNNCKNFRIFEADIVFKEAQKKIFEDKVVDLF